MAHTPTTTTLPLVVDGVGSISPFICAHRVRAELLEQGAVLLHGFEVDGVGGFDQAVRGLSGSPLTYRKRSSPRSTIKGQVYTSTDYSPDEEIFLHNENSYQANWPSTLLLLLHPATPPATGATTCRGLWAGSVGHRSRAVPAEGPGGGLDCGPCQNRRVPRMSGWRAESEASA